MTASGGGRCGIDVSRRWVCGAPLSLQADVSAPNDLIDQIRGLLITIDRKAQPLDERNKAALKTLAGLLQTTADRTLLDQITGPTTQSSGNAPPAPPAP